jgi:hypothetical protein
VTPLLWTLQALLALLFVFAGATKLVLPLDQLTAQIPLPELFLRAVGLAELLGGLGLVLPGLLRVRPGLTIVAAVELAHLMLGATLLTLATTDPAALAAIPLGVGLLTAFVAYARFQRLPARRRLAVPTGPRFQPSPAR